MGSSSRSCSELSFASEGELSVSDLSPSSLVGQMVQHLLSQFLLEVHLQLALLVYLKQWLIHWSLLDTIAECLNGLF